MVEPAGLHWPMTLRAKGRPKFSHNIQMFVATSPNEESVSTLYYFGLDFIQSIVRKVIRIKMQFLLAQAATQRFIFRQSGVNELRVSIVKKYLW